jgi:nucleoside-diphosphate kinase
MQQTLILLKPDAVQRRLVGTITDRFERKGLRLAGLKLVHPTRDRAEQHYAVHKGKPFYESLLTFLTSGRRWRWCGRGGRRWPSAGRSWG